LNHAIVVQAACQPLVRGTVCLQAAGKLLANKTHTSDDVIVTRDAKRGQTLEVEVEAEVRTLRLMQL